MCNAEQLRKGKHNSCAVYAGLFIQSLFVILLFANCSKKKQVITDGLRVPDGYTIEKVAGADMLSYPMFASFDNSGRLFVFESSGKTTSTEDILENPTFLIRVLEDENGDGIFDKSNVFADKIPYPMGGAFYQGSLYVAAPPNLMRLTDTDGDGVADKRDIILSGWIFHHNGATLSGPFIGPDGWFYMADARRGFNIKTKEGDSLKGKGARIWRCRPDGTGLESISGGGFDNSVEIAFMPSGETLGTMTYFTDPQGGFRDAIMHWVEGGVYPKPQEVIEEDHLKLTGDLMPVMTKLARVSHAGLMRYRGNVFGEAFKGNLFTAQFNTGRIMRHIVTPDDATFRTTDEPFVQSDSADTHLTDVLEDADGSLLVVNTGGWFIAGCPLSVVAKTNVLGGIYRIRKTGAPVVQDPWGKKLDFKNASSQELVTYMMDERQAVRDQAIEQMVLKGDTAADILKKSFPLFKDEEMRAAAVFALSRMQSSSAREGVRNAMNDESAMVRTAAVRSSGLAKDKAALDKLMELVQNDQAPVRRQAATAIGQIGDEKAVAALLQAAVNPDDRFVEHAVIYSLITIGKAQLLIEALNDASIHKRRAALIALDQMDGSPLQKEQLETFLNSKDTLLRNTGIWVALHHTNWSDIVVNFISKQFSAADSPGNIPPALSVLMEAFCRKEALQQFMGAQLGNAATPVFKKIFLMSVIARSDLGDMPQAWIKSLGDILKGTDDQLRLQVMSLLESKRMEAMNGVLNQIIRDPKTPVAFQLKAFGARLRSDKELSDKEFSTLQKYLDSSYEAPVRQAAVRLLAQAELNDAQLVILAKEQIPKADVFLLPGLVQAFKGNRTEATGKSLIAALNSSTDRLGNLSLLDLQELIKNFPSVVQVSAEPLIKTLEAQQATRLLQLQHLEANLKRGDVSEGRLLFFGKATCFTCHAVTSEGGTFGPDLTNIGEIRSRHDLLEAIVYPSVSFAREHETSRIITKTGTYTGIITEQLPDAVIITTGPGTKMSITRAEISSIEPQNVSMMPPGLDKILNEQELANLLAYLVSLPSGLGQIKSH
ncbi:PVC-type heme-binding CxxCH protein [Agriterribacter sp.]|uniref:PVC-type heme-binding CxxCH protein n=1 Tax=Agriterribacter sp. TaxID=2821509 RepID=UPI002B905EC2|nr:PVC-type heme-binding CxxCH protein [Agriterribacter sp.]HRO44718.1 HEAT repeat domain-containing protein [Agriterribacter sp.]HRQ16391.1 HEAT repeat domain-containing protein [Agriterribacter sp.]